MKKLIFTCLLTLFHSNLLLIAQSGWADKGSYKEMPYPVDKPILMDKSPDDKLLYIISTNNEKSKTFYSVVDFETGVIKSKIDIPSKNYGIISDDGKILYYSDSLRFIAVEAGTGKEVFNIQLESKKEFGDSLNGISYIGNIFSWKDKEHFFVTINCQFKPNGNYDAGLTGNYYIIDKSGNIEYSSELIGSILYFVPGKDQNSYIISYYYSNYQAPDFNTNIMREMRLYSNDNFTIFDISKPADFGEEMDAMVSIATMQLNIFDVKSLKNIKQIAAPLFNNAETYFIDCRFLPGGRYLAVIHQLLYYQQNYCISIIDVETGITAYQDSLPVLSSNKTILFTLGNTIICNGSNKLIKIEPKFLNSDFMAYYSAATRHIIEGSEAKFSNFSSGNPDSVRWEFGDGATATEWNTGHIFSKPGAYDVTLTAYKGINKDVYTVKECIIVHKMLTPELLVEPPSGIPPFNITVENKSHEGDFEFNLGDDFSSVTVNKFNHKIINPGNIYIWLNEYDSIFSFTSHKIVKSEYLNIISPVYSMNKVFPEEYISSNIETVLDGNTNNIIYKSKYKEYDKQNFTVIREYYKIHSIGKDFKGLQTIKEYSEDIDIVKLENGNFLVLFKKEGQSIFEMDENGNEISKDKYLPGEGMKTLSVKQGKEGMVFVENTDNAKSFITALNSYGVKMWEIETNLLTSYLPLNDGGLAIGYNINTKFGFYTFPHGFIEYYNKAGILTRKIGLDSSFYVNSGYSYKSPELLYQKQNNEIVYRMKADGTLYPQPTKLLTTDNVVLNSDVPGYIFVIDEYNWLKQNNGTCIYNTLSNDAIIDSLNKLYSMNTAFKDGEYLYFGGNVFNSYIPSENKGSLGITTNSCLLKTRLLSELTGVEDAKENNDKPITTYFDNSGENIIVSLDEKFAGINYIEVYDMMGRRICRFDSNNQMMTQNELKIFVGNIQSGIYFVSCGTTSGALTERAVKAF